MLGQRSAAYALFGLIGLALALRVWGIGFGLPFDFTPDEVHEIVRALKLGAGEFSWAIGKGGLYLVLFAEYCLLFAWWWLTGRVHGASDFALLYLQDPTAFYLLGRLTVAMMGVLTCLVIFHIGKRVHSWRIGFGAALIGATAHFHAAWSHYINVDIGMTLAVWASILAYLEFEKSDQRKWLVVAGSLAGVAIAFKLPGGIVLLPLSLAMVTPRAKWSAPGLLLKRAGIMLLAMSATLVVIAPELVLGSGHILGFFSNITSVQPMTKEVVDEESAAIFSLTQLTQGSYIRILFKSTYALLTVGAALGAAVGCYRKHRWDMIWLVVVAAFLAVMYAADRPGQERYLLPVMPALWLLSARAVDAISGQRNWLMGTLLAVIVAIPLYYLVEQDFMWTRPDTRVLAKSWIEKNVVSGSKLLMDGMQYRFIQSPPLSPDELTVKRKVEQASEEEGNVSRGVSDRSLALYARAMKRVSGPRYELHSTVFGLEVKDLSYYLQACFNYIITSSDVSRRFLQPGENQRHPISEMFYRQLPVDPRFKVVYVAAPVPWRVQGPTIVVYEVLHSCE